MVTQSSCFACFCDLDVLRCRSLPTRDVYADEKYLAPVMSDDALLVWAVSFGERVPDGEPDVAAMTQEEQDEIEARVRADVDMAALSK